VLNAQAQAITLRQDGPLKTIAFYHPSDILGLKVFVVGRVQSFSERDDLENSGLSGNLTPKTKVTVRLSTHDSIREGDELYIINSDNLITGRVQVKHILNTSDFGHLLIGYGHFKNCRESDRVVQKFGERDVHFAASTASRGDYYRVTGEYAKAIVEYQKALELDAKNPSSHLGLGLIYLKQDMLQFAFKEFYEAYKQLKYLYSNEDKFLVFQGMTEVRYKEVFEGQITNSLREQYRNEGIKYGNEALKYYSDSVSVNYILGRLYYNSVKSNNIDSSEDDKKARDYFLKVVKVEQAHEGANIALAELYLRHNNPEKARHYVQKIITHDKFNERARKLLAYIDNYNQNE
jgi:tetratricopeptide (TPR) repeat protein